MMNDTDNAVTIYLYGILYHNY